MKNSAPLVNFRRLSVPVPWWLVIWVVIPVLLWRLVGRGVFGDCGWRCPVTAAFYQPLEVAAMLRCSEWWVKEQARRRRIPFCWIGGGYLFTAEHVAEIVRLFEVRPVEGDDAAPSTPVRRPTTAPGGEGVVQLRARRPRRARHVHTSGSSAA